MGWNPFSKKKKQTAAKRKKSIFLDHDGLAQIRKLRSEGKLDEADRILYSAEPSPAVLDELRKNASLRAKQAKKDGNWQAVIDYLEGYTSYANEHRDECIKMANAEPPGHTKSDLKLLESAKQAV